MTALPMAYASTTPAKTVAIAVSDEVHTTCAVAPVAVRVSMSPGCICKTEDERVNEGVFVGKQPTRVRAHDNRPRTIAFFIVGSVLLGL